MNMKRTLICLGLAAAFTTALAIDPRLSSISPAGVQVGKEVVLTFNGSRLDDAEEILFYKKGFEVVKLEATAASIPMKRLGSAEDCVGAYLFLAAPELSGYVTGQVLNVCGGASVS